MPAEPLQPAAPEEGRELDLPLMTVAAEEPNLREEAPGVPLEPSPTYLQTLVAEAEEDLRARKIAITVAVVFHVILLLVKFPDLRQAPREIHRGVQAYVVQQVRFKPPPPQAQRSIPKRKTRKIPIPDPTPDEPEPIVDEDVVELDFDIDQDALTVGIPEGPPGFPGGFAGAMPLGGNITPPQKIFAPQPHYTEEARQARLQGIVILQAVVDTEGRVTNVKVLKGLDLGLSESAVETVKQWRFKPATLEGKPVPVYFNFTVSFSLQ